ncbi:MAG: AbiV family abortive infection protein [Nitrososphaeraceae archaeon]
MCLYITASDIDVGIELCRKKATTLAEDSVILLKNNGNLSHALGLYLFALEEYGKKILLEESKPHSPQVNQKVWVNCSIFISHNKKLQRTSDKLPKKIKINIVITIRNNNSNKSKTIKIYPPKYFTQENILFNKKSNKNNIMSIPQYTTGTFETLDGVPQIEQLRWRCFFIDYDKNENCWLEEFRYDKEQLIQAISTFKNHINKKS